MMTPHQRVRAVVDNLAKRKAQRPALPTGGDRRTLGEAVNTGANARNLARMNVKQGEVARIRPLREVLARVKKGKF